MTRTYVRPGRHCDNCKQDLVPGCTGHHCKVCAAKEIYSLVYMFRILFMSLLTVSYNILIDLWLWLVQHLLRGGICCCIIAVVQTFFTSSTSCDSFPHPQYTCCAHPVSCPWCCTHQYLFGRLASTAAKNSPFFYPAWSSIGRRNPWNAIPCSC